MTFTASLPVASGWGPTHPPARATNSVVIGRTTVEVSADPIENAIIDVREGADLNGLVLIDGSPSANGVLPSIRPDDTASQIGGTFGQVFNQVTQFRPLIDVNGTFRIPVVPEARYRFQILLGKAAAQAPPSRNDQRTIPSASDPVLAESAYVADIREGGRSVYDTGINIGPQPLEPVVITISTNGGAIEGTIVGADRRPVAGSTTVVLIPDEGRRQNPALYKITLTNTEGQFVLKGIPPGTWKLFAWERIPSGAYMSPQFLEQYEQLGTTAIISGGSQLRIDIEVIHAR